MAVTLVGSREGKEHPDVPVDQAPLIPDVEVEDVVIHFRCGDVMGGVRRNDFGMISFSEYKKWISKDARSVGIVTQPFGAELNRPDDRRKVENCRAATYLMVETLQKFLPSAEIKIHNEKDDTLPLTYARLVMADQSFTTLSSFGIFPVIGTFGKGYFQRGHKGLNEFTNFLPEVYPDKLFAMDGPFKSSAELSRMTLESILDWLRGEDDEESDDDEGFSNKEPDDKDIIIADDGNEKIEEEIAPWDSETYESLLEQRRTSNNNIQVMLPNNITGEIMHDGQLVVNLVNRTDHMLWNYGQTNLCSLLQSMALVDSIPSPVESSDVALANRPLLNMTIDCVGLQKDQHALGQGNWVVAVYTTRITAAAARVDFHQFQCYDGDDSRMDYLLP